MGIGDWGLGIGDWGLGIGANPQSPIPNPQSPIPMYKEESSIKNAYNFYLNKKNNYNKKNDENKFFWLFQFCIII